MIFVNPVTFWSMYFSIAGAILLALLYAHSKDKIQYEDYVPEGYKSSLFILCAILWPLTLMLGWLVFDPGIEIVWDDNSKIGKLRLWILRKIKEYRGK